MKTEEPASLRRFIVAPPTHYCRTIHVTGRGGVRSVPTGLRRRPGFATRAPRMTEKPAEGSRRSYQLHTRGLHWATAGLWPSAEIWQCLQAKAWQLVQTKVCLLQDSCQGLCVGTSREVPFPIEKMYKTPTKHRGQWCKTAVKTYKNTPVFLSNIMGDVGPLGHAICLLGVIRKVDWPVRAASHSPSVNKTLCSAN